MKRMLQISALLIALATSSSALAEKAASASVQATDAPPFHETTLGTSVLEAMDPDASPCEDFYRYSCGGWRDATTLPEDKARWTRSFSTIHEHNREIIRTLVDAAAADPGADPDRRRIGRFYGSCMDERRIEEAGARPLHPILERIAQVEGKEKLMATVARLHRYHVDALFAFQSLPDFKNPNRVIAVLSQGGLGMPDRDYYLSDDEKKKELMLAYEAHVASMLRLLGDDEASSKSQAADIVAFETSLAEGSRPRSEMRNAQALYNKIDLEGLIALTPKLPWKTYFTDIGYPKIVDINVATPEFFEHLRGLLADTSENTLRAYLRWAVVRAMAPRLSSDFVEADFQFFTATLSGQKEIEPRWKRCIEASERAIGQAIGKLYVEQEFQGDSKQVALEMIHDIEAAFEAALPDLAWMDKETRGHALDKMKAIRNKIGYPEKWRDYSALELDPKDYFANALAVAEFSFDRQASKIGGPMDRQEWLVPPQVVNAYYSPPLNEIAFPAGILQPPFFHRDFPAAMNYGAIGAVMGHELSHGFDDQGRKFDGEGRLREWWAPQVVEKFVERASCVEEQYGAYEIQPGVKVDGRLTLGENIADSGGLKQAYAAYKAWEKRQAEPPSPAVSGLTDDQLFFIAWGQIWCSVTSPEIDRVLATTDPHSPARFRVNGTLANHPAFAETFGCKADAPMLAQGACEVW